HPSPHPASTTLYPPSLHDALPIWRFADINGHMAERQLPIVATNTRPLAQPEPPEIPAFNYSADPEKKQLYFLRVRAVVERRDLRSEEHTSELQSRFDLVCRLLLEK